tara:strand:- start:1864 stop:2316 length:453 start_codon:yes stop_codon:yes gene_type:complete
LKKSAKKESNIFVVSLVAILVVALIGINLDKLTGKASSDIYPSFSPKTTITLSTNDRFVNAGDYVTVSVNPGPKCVNRIVGFYDDADFRRATAQPISAQFGSNKKLCNSFDVRFKTYAEWKPAEDETGVFFAKVFDYETEDFISTTFTIN